MYSCRSVTGIELLSTENVYERCFHVYSGIVTCSTKRKPIGLRVIRAVIIYQSIAMGFSEFVIYANYIYVT